MSITYNDYQDLLLSYNFVNTEGQTLIDDTGTTADDYYAKVTVQNNKYVFKYHFFDSVSSMAMWHRP